MILHDLLFPDKRQGARSWRGRGCRDALLSCSENGWPHAFELLKR